MSHLDKNWVDKKKKKNWAGFIPDYKPAYIPNGSKIEMLKY